MRRKKEGRKEWARERMKGREGVCMRKEKEHERDKDINRSQRKYLGIRCVYRRIDTISLVIIATYWERFGTDRVGPLLAIYSRLANKLMLFVIILISKWRQITSVYLLDAQHFIWGMFWERPQRILRISLERSENILRIWIAFWTSLGHPLEVCAVWILRNKRKLQKIFLAYNTTAFMVYTCRPTRASRQPRWAIERMSSRKKKKKRKMKKKRNQMKQNRVRIL